MTLALLLGLMVPAHADTAELIERQRAIDSIVSNQTIVIESYPVRTLDDFNAYVMW